MLDTIQEWDARRDIVIPGNKEQTIAFAAEHWVHSAQRAIQQRGAFKVALSGGSTPKAIFEQLSEVKNLDWSKIWLFWGDERAVPPDHPDSNYHMALTSGFSKLPIPPSQIFRMKAEAEIEKNGQNYHELLKHHMPLDLVMLGVGEDGHTASLFPNTPALEISDLLATSNSIPQKKSCRMTLTFPCLNKSLHTAIYALGESKQLIVPQVLDAPILSSFPASRVGTAEHKALWILDKEAAKLLNFPLKK